MKSRFSRISAVDPVLLSGDQGYSRFESIPASDPVDLWIISSPTHLHLEHLRAVLKRDPHASIILEKPACAFGESTALWETIQDHPQARIVVSDIYSTSPAVQCWAALVREIEQRSPLVELTVEMSKNRNQDEIHGRFVDQGFGDAGYEGFHLFSIVRAALEEWRYRKLLKGEWDRSHSTGFAFAARGLNLPTVRIATSVRGPVIWTPPSIECLFPGIEPLRAIHAREIPNGSEFRYRIAFARFENGETASLAFESEFGTDETDWKNIHTVEHAGDGFQNKTRVTGNQFESGVTQSIEALERHWTGRLVDIQEIVLRQHCLETLTQDQRNLDHATPVSISITAPA